MEVKTPFIKPIDFTDDEIRRARTGDSEVIAKRLKKELRVRSEMFQAIGRPRMEAELKRMVRK